MKNGNIRKWWVVAGVFLVLIAFYHLIYSQFFPTKYGTLGHDYAYVLPRLLAGLFWFKSNGLDEVPWFTPAFCGGVPFLSDPQSFYYSVPQFLSFVFGPVTSIYVTFLLFAGVLYAQWFLYLSDDYRPPLSRLHVIALDSVMSLK